MSDERTADWRDAARPGRRIGHAVEAHDRIGSTNDRARELLLRSDGEGTLVVAEAQVAGRGRRGRTWLSPPGKNLTVSVGLRPRVAAAKAWQLGLAVALAARDACLPLAPVALKWPNDLVDASGAKLGGLLIETILDGERIDSAVIGVGINVNWDRAEMPPELAATATSLRELGGSPVDRVALLGSLAAALERRVADVEGGRAPLDEYRAACSTLGAMVTVETADGTVTGRALAIEDGGVLVLEGAGGIVRIANGELVRLVPGAAA